MDPQQPSLLAALLATIPIVTVLALMAGLRWGGHQAGPLAWCVTLAVACLGFGANSQVVLWSQVKALLQSLTVLYIVWAGLLLYNVMSAAGAIRSIGHGLARLTRDPAMQMILLAWAFGSFLEGATGFGIPIAVAAPLLIGLGISPSVAVVGTLVGHGWAVPLGNVGTSLQALMAASRLEAHLLTPWIAVLSGLACLGCGCGVVHAWGGMRGTWRAAGPIVAVGGAMAVAQYALGALGLWSLASLGAGLVGLGVGMALARAGNRHPVDEPAGPQEDLIPFGWAVLPYIALIALILAVSQAAPLRSALNRVVLAATIPETRTALGWTQPAERVRSISLLGHPGALLSYVAILSYALFWWRGRYGRRAVALIARRTWDAALKATIGILAMVGLAALMEQAGMSRALAQGLSDTVGVAFPFFSAFLGGLGAFATGSSTSSNFMLGALQLTTARLLRLDVLVILAAQTTGGGLGSMAAPAKVIVGCSTAGLVGQEGPVLRRALAYTTFLLGLVGLLTWAWAG